MTDAIGRIGGIKTVAPQNISHRNSDGTSRGFQSFVYGIGVVYWRINHHSQRFVYDFEFDQIWNMKAGQSKPSYNSGTPFSV